MSKRLVFVEKGPVKNDNITIDNESIDLSRESN